MSKRESVARQQHIIARLKRKPASFEDIMAYLGEASSLEGYDYVVSKRTFHRDLDDISSLYQVDIQYDRLNKVYRMDADMQPEMNKRVLEALDTVRIQKLASNLSDFIFFEKRVPHGTEHLYGLVHAIKNTVKAKFVYHKFWNDDFSNRSVEPYALKESRNRWYLLAKDDKDGNLKSFGLDRISDLEITSVRFDYPADFNVTEYYKYSFGIVAPDGSDPEEITLSLDPVQGQFVKSLPLHDSQEILIDNKKELRIRLKLNITHDFVMELLSMGENVKVLEPVSLVNALKQVYLKALKRYR